MFQYKVTVYYKTQDGELLDVVFDLNDLSKMDTIAEAVCPDAIDTIYVQRVHSPAVIDEALWIDCG